MLIPVFCMDNVTMTGIWFVTRLLEIVAHLENLPCVMLACANWGRLTSLNEPSGEE